MRHSSSQLLATVLWVLTLGGVAQADVFVLKNGGRIEGELVNPDEVPRQKYVVRTTAGAEITLERAQIKQVLRPKPEELEYAKIQPRYADTVEDQWALAQWCQEHRLRDQREKHLRRILELDPDHVNARHALGYGQFDGKWKTQAEVQTERGLVLDGGRWRTPQEIESKAEKEKIEVAEKAWMKKLNRLLLAARNDSAARDAITEINDPFAVAALAQTLKKDPNDQVRILVAEVLAKIGTNQATMALAYAAIEDQVSEVRLSCLDHLKQRDHPAAVDYFVKRLNNKDKDNTNEIINRAAIALKQMGNPSAIGPLIDSLNTTHKHVIQADQGRIGASFSPQTGGGLSMGGGPKILRQDVQNRPVLEALVALSGVNFGFDEQAWKAWHAKQNRETDVNTRRD